MKNQPNFVGSSTSLYLDVYFDLSENINLNSTFLSAIHLVVLSVSIYLTYLNESLVVLVSRERRERNFKYCQRICYFLF